MQTDLAKDRRGSKRGKSRVQPSGSYEYIIWRAVSVDSDRMEHRSRLAHPFGQFSCVRMRHYDRMDCSKKKKQTNFFYEFGKVPSCLNSQQDEHKSNIFTALFLTVFLFHRNVCQTVQNFEIFIKMNFETASIVDFRFIFSKTLLLFCSIFFC